MKQGVPDTLDYNNRKKSPALNGMRGMPLYFFGRISGSLTTINFDEIICV